MAARIYTERFLHGFASATSQTLIVPVGKRAVVRSVVVQVFDDASLDFNVKVNGQVLVHVHDPAVWTTRVWDLRAVAYAGEAIAMVVAGGDIAWHVAGFMFTDV